MSSTPMQTKSLKLRPCFIVTPYGERRFGKIKLNFDVIDEQLVSKAARQAGFYPERCDESLMGGPITNTMIRKLQSAALVITDITGGTPNAMYELGMRLAFAPFGTLLIKAQGVRKRRSGYEVVWDDPTPFNIKDLPYLVYQFDVKTGDIVTTPDELEQRIREVQANKLNHVDSPVYVAIPDFRAERRPRPLSPERHIDYHLIDHPERLVGIRTGDILEVTDIDYWTNSENTQFMMARPYDQSISASIRAAGGQFPDTPREEDELQDLIADELKQHVGPRGSVNAGTVRATSSGNLLHRNHVKAILHVASVRGARGEGYRPVDDLAKCIRNLMREADETARSKDSLGGGSSLLIPMIGSGTARGQATPIAVTIIETALECWRQQEDSRLNRIEFLAYTQADLDIIHRVLNAMSNIQGNNNPLVVDRDSAAPN